MDVSLVSVEGCSCINDTCRLIARWHRHAERRPAQPGLRGHLCGSHSLSNTMTCSMLRGKPFDSSSTSVVGTGFCLCLKQDKTNKKQHSLEEWFLCLKTETSWAPAAEVMMQLGLRRDLRIWISKCSINHSMNLISFGKLTCREGIRKLMLETRKNMATLPVPVVQFKIAAFTNLEKNKRVGWGGEVDI